MSGNTANNVVYFTTTATSGSYPAALWVSNGTGDGTQLVSSYNSPLGLIDGFGYDGAFAFVVTEPGETTVDATLGSPDSTRALSYTLVVPAGPITATAQSVQSQYAFLNSGTLIGGLGLGFGADVVETNFTDDGTNVLLSLSAQSYLSTEYVTDFTAFGNDVYFIDGNADGVSNLYATDGTTYGTVKLFSAPLIDSLTLGTNAATGQRLFFGEIAANGDGELEALASGATAATTIFDFGAAVTVDSITNADNELFIVTNNGTNVGLWASDASNDAPVEIGTFTALPQQMTPAADGSAQVFFQLGNEVLVASSSTVTVLGSFAAVGSLYAMGGDLYFAANDGTDGMQLWQSDGTASGTTMLTDINPGTTGFAPAEFTSLNGELYFTATDGSAGAELWESDGTTSGTTLVENVAPGATGVTITSIVAGPSIATAPTGALVTYEQHSSQNGLYASTDGTVSGTQSGSSAPPGALSFSVSAGNLTISHGTPDTTITVQLAPSGTSFFSYPTLAAGPGGDFIAFTTIDYGATYATDSGDYTDNSLLYFIGDTSTTPVLVGSFVPSAQGLSAQIFDLVNAGSLEYFLLQSGTGDTQLWSSDGTAANTREVQDLGAVLSNPGTPSVQDPIATGSLGWAALLANGSGDLDLYTLGGSAPITPADIGLSGATFDSSAQPIAEDDGLYFLSVTNGASVEAIATNGTTSTVLASEPTSTSSGFGDFTVSGSLVYFDDGSNGALYVSDGTAAGTTQLLSSGALIAPYALSGGAAAATPSTVSVVSDSTTWFYFAATESGSTGLYRTDGTTVQQIVASGVATNPYLVASDGMVFFVAAGASGTTTVWYTDPTTTTAQAVISSTLYPAGSFLADAYGPSQDPTDLQAATAYPFAPDTYFLTTGADTVTGGSGDTAIYAYAGDLNAGDTIDGGGGINNLYLVGPGSFDLSAPATLANITQVLYDDDGQTITLRPGTSLDVHPPSGDYSGTGATIIGAANSDVIDAFGSADTVIVGGPQETVEYATVVTLTATDAAASIEGAGTLFLVGGGSFDLTSADAGTIELEAPTTLTLDEPSGSGVIIGSSGADTITIANYGNYVIEGKGGADVFNLATVSDTFTTAPAVEFYDTAADLNGVTITGFNFAPSPYGFDDIDITDFAYSSAEKVLYANGTLTVDEFGNGQTVITMDVPGAPAAGGFVAAGDGESGTLLKFYPQVFTLTTGADTIDGTTLNVIFGTEDTLNAGDTINGGASLYSNTQSTLELIGAGSFDLSAPATLTGLSAVIGDTTGEQVGSTLGLAQTITLRNGFTVPVTLGPGHDTVYGAEGAGTISSVAENYSSTQGDTVYLGDAREAVQLEGVPADVVYTDAATGGASVSDDLEGSFSTTGTLAVTGGGVVGLGNADVGIVMLAAPTNLWLTGDAPRVIQGSTGTDRIDTGIAPSGFGGFVTIEPDGGADTVVAPLLFSMLLSGTGAQLDGTTIAAFNFFPAAADTSGVTTPDTIDITDMTYSTGVSLDFASDTLTVDNAGSIVTFLLPGAPNVGSFVATTDGANGTDITYVPPAGGTVDNATIASGATGFIGSPGDDTLTVDAGALAAGQTIDGEGGNNELVLSGTGDFDLSAPATLADFQDLVASGSNETITLRAGLSLDIQVIGTADTLVGADSPDPIVLEGYSNGGATVIVNNPSATVIDQGDYNTIEVSAASVGASIYGGRIGQDQLLVTGGGTAVMGDNIYDIAQVDLTQSGLWFQGNSLPDLSIVLNGTTGAPPDTVIAGSGGGTIADFSPGGNILAGGAGNDLFVLGSIGVGLIPTPTGDTLYNFAASGNDTLDFAVVEQGTVSYDSGTGNLTLTGLIDPTGSIGTVSVHLAGSYDGTFSADSDNAYGTDVVFSGTTSPTTVPCYCRGTRIAVPGGETAVEALRIGDLVMTAGGTARPIRWIGRRSYSGRFAARNRHVQPVLICSGALAENMPRRDLYVSPNHAMYLDGVLIPAVALVNGTSIMQREVVDQVDYFHLELDVHDIVLADGAPAETFVDDASRGLFHNAHEYRERYPDAAPACARFCAPRLEDGAELEAVRRRLAARASGRSAGASAGPSLLEAYPDTADRARITA